MKNVCKFQNYVYLCKVIKNKKDMKTKIIYTVEAAEKLVKNGITESGDTIVTKTFSTELQAKKAGDKLLKQKNILSVWIHKYNEETNGDPLYQWKKYEGDVKWTGGCYW